MAFQLVNPGQPARLMRFGTVAERLANNVDSDGRLTVNALRTNALLRDDEWKVVDETVVRIARGRLNAIMDLRNAGLDIDNGGLGTLLHQYETVSDMTDAEQNMSPVSQSDEDTAEFTLNTVPIPVTIKEFSIDVRRLQASRRRGESLDTTQIETATRLVRDRLEDTAFSGNTTISVDGNDIPGYTTFGDRATGSASDFGTFANIRSSVEAMIADAEAKNFFGPFVLYVSTTQFGEMRARDTDGSGETAREQVENIEEIEAVKPADRLADGNLVLVQLSRDVVDLSVGQDITPVEWDARGGFVQHFAVIAVMAQRLKSDDAGNTGIVHHTGA